MWRVLRCRRPLCGKVRRSISSNSRLALLENVIDAEEEAVLIKIVSQILARKRYEGNHWDDVIVKYKEVDLGSHLKRLNQTDPDMVIIQSILTRLKDRISKELQRNSIPFQSPHVIDLASDGWIGPHIDSVKFSGDLIAGLSLGTQRSMVMTRDPESEEYMLPQDVDEYRNLPDKYEFPLKRRSLYIMTGLWRYHFKHEITPAQLVDGEVGGSDSHNGRRISIILRNESS